MYPEICKIGPLVVYSYGFMLVVAFFVAVTLASQEAKRHEINPDLIFNLLFISFIFGIIGARIFYVVENLGIYLKEPLEIIMLSHGGISWFGGLIVGTLSGIIYLKRKNMSVYKTLDLIVPFLALGQSLGRIGCFLNGCCFGKEFVLIPVQIISSFLLLLIFIILRFLQGQPHKVGQVFYSYLFLYSIKRFFIEFWRADNKIIFFDFTLFQLISILIFVFSTVKLVIILKHKLNE
jgi:phosphatidylglycerol:prolipoprotein diacylglycerol transferase